MLRHDKIDENGFCQAVRSIYANMWEVLKL